MEKEFEKFRNHNPFKVPDGFFDNITNQALEKARLRSRNRSEERRVGKECI